MTPEPTPGPEQPGPDDGPLDPFEDGVPLADGVDDIDAPRTPSSASRLLSSFIDLVVAYLTITVLDTIIIVSAVHPGKKLTPAQQRQAILAFYLVATVVAIGFILVERYTGRTLGKRLLRLRLMSKAGVRPSTSLIALRYAVMFMLGMLMLSVPFGAVLVLGALGYAARQPQRRNAFDLLVGTRVMADPG